MQMLRAVQFVNYDGMHTVCSYEFSKQQHRKHSRLNVYEKILNHMP